MVDLDKNSLQKNFVLNKKLLKQLGYIIKDDLLIKDNVEVTNLEIPANYTYNGKIYEIKQIEANTFSYIKNLNHITIPNTVIEIGNCAFFNCKNLSVVNMSNSVKKIGKSAFSKCKKLTNIKIPRNSLISITTFFDCGFTRDVTEQIVKKRNELDKPILRNLTGFSVIYFFCYIIFTALYGFNINLIHPLFPKLAYFWFFLSIIFVLSLIYLGILHIILNKRKSWEINIMQERIKNYYI